MEVQTRPMTGPEYLYSYAQSQQISKQSGLIGHLRADMGADGKSFFSSFFDFRQDLKSQDFSQDLQEFIDGLRKDGFLKDRDVLKKYCRQHPECDLGTGREFGIRADTDHYTYMLRLNPNKGEYNLYCHCYVRQWLERHMKQAEKGIRFITPEYQELFRISDGDSIREWYDDKNCSNRICRYIDDYHVEIGSAAYHIHQYAELMNNIGASVVPLRKSLPDFCYAHIETENKVGSIRRGCSGYYSCTDPFTGTPAEVKAHVDELNRKAGITKAQAEAMKAGSMFGFHVPAADPKNYDDKGQPIRPKNKDRGEAR